MNPPAKTTVSARPKPEVTDGPQPTSSLVDNIPVHDPGRTGAPHDEDAELDKIMQDVGRDLRRESNDHQKHHFWQLGQHHKKEANFSTQKSIQNAQRRQSTPPRPATAHPPAAAPKSPAPRPPAAHPKLKTAPASLKKAKQPKPPKQPGQRRIPVAVTLLTILVTAALIAAAYQAYK